MLRGTVEIVVVLLSKIVHAQVGGPRQDSFEGAHGRLRKRTLLSYRRLRATRNPLSNRVLVHRRVWHYAANAIWRVVSTSAGDSRRTWEGARVKSARVEPSGLTNSTS